MRRQKPKIEIADRTGRSKTITSLLRQVLRKSLEELKLSNREVSVLLVNNREMQKLNRQYRGKKRPTDVLSFSQEPNKKEVLLGDIVIAIPIARKQAKEHRHSLQRECAVLAVHGLLHLLGYDHEKPRDAKTMFAKQNKLLSRVARA